MMRHGSHCLLHERTHCARESPVVVVVYRTHAITALAPQLSRVACVHVFRTGAFHLLCRPARLNRRASRRDNESPRDRFCTGRIVRAGDFVGRARTRSRNALVCERERAPGYEHTRPSNWRS